MSKIIKEAERLATPLLQAENIELVDLTYQKGPGGWALCFYLDKSGGITLDECASWSDRLGEVMDACEVIHHTYSLEVSSPGLYRPIKKLEDFSRFAGKCVAVHLYAPLNNQKNYKGILLGEQDGDIRLEQEDGKEISIAFKSIAKANLDPVVEI